MTATGRQSWSRSHPTVSVPFANGRVRRAALPWAIERSQACSSYEGRWIDTAQLRRVACTASRSLSCPHAQPAALAVAGNAAAASQRLKSAPVNACSIVRSYVRAHCRAKTARERLDRRSERPAGRAEARPVQADGDREH